MRVHAREVGALRARVGCADEFVAQLRRALDVALGRDGELRLELAEAALLARYFQRLARSAACSASSAATRSAFFASASERRAVSPGA